MAAYADPRADQKAIVKALGRIGDDAAVDLVADIYHQRSADEIGQAALEALRAIGGPRAEEESRAANAVREWVSSDPERHAEGIAELWRPRPATNGPFVAHHSIRTALGARRPIAGCCCRDQSRTAGIPREVRR
jgi:hypothetical protein